MTGSLRRILWCGVPAALLAAIVVPSFAAARPEHLRGGVRVGAAPAAEAPPAAETPPADPRARIVPLGL
jgi:hypothetical protein